MTLNHITQKLNGVKRSQHGFIAKCPAHNDEKQSLSLGESGGKVLLNCFAGCPPEKIVEAMGMEFKDLFEGCKPFDLIDNSFRDEKMGVAYHAPAKAKVAAVYRYTDETGVLLYENVRFEPKGFSQRRYVGKGKYAWDLRGVRRVPYRLQQLVDNARYGSDIWLCEGEKDADSLAELGFIASSFKNWSQDFNKYLTKTNVVIVRDHDLPGGVQANEAARLISKTAAMVKVLDVYAEYDMPEKHGPDISDYIRSCVQDEGLTREEIAERLSLMADGCARWFGTGAMGTNLFVVKSGNQWLDEAKKRPSPKMLFGEFWFEGELCILFADTNVGKSILAVQVGDAISKGNADAPVRTEHEVRTNDEPPLNVGSTATPSASYARIADEGVRVPTECPPRRVVYFDFELTDKQFESRLSTRQPGSDTYVDHYRFNENFRRAEVNPETSDLNGFKTFEEFLNHSLDKTITEEKADVLIIDNLTYLRDETENARNALPLMKYLKELKSRHSISILALAHTPKRDSTKPLGRNDLQGSKMLINFCDSSFAIGESHKEAGLRYLKQIKARNTAIIYHADNVLLCTIEKRDSLLQFVFNGTATEREHLRAGSEKEKAVLMKRVKELADDGMSTREIADEVGISHSTVSRYIKQPVETVSTVSSVSDVSPP